LTAKQQHSFLDNGIKPEFVPRSFLYVLPSLNIESHQASKKDNSEGSTGSKSNHRIMKSYQNIQKGSGTKKNQKRKTLLDTISKSLNINPSTLW